MLLVIAFKMLTLFNLDVHAWAEDFITRHGIDIANRYVQSTLERLTGVGNRQLVELSIGATVYTGLLFTEGIGLWLQKRWAEYMTAGLTALFIPVEIYEIFERFTWVRVAILALNIFVVWYLATRLKDEKNEPFSTASSSYYATRVKVCGITNLEDALLSVECGADELGFNFYKKSPRYISPKKASLITQQLPNSVLRVGVFVNESVEKILETAILVGLDVIQLHGDEDADFIENLLNRPSLSVIKAFRVGPDFSINEVAKNNADAILLDGYSLSERGGTGDKFDWEIAKTVSVAVPFLYLAGGLTPENVADAINQVHPYAVDVCSRIESEPGKKDPEKLRRFIAAVTETI